jgi:cell division protein FtsB
MRWIALGLLLLLLLLQYRLWLAEGSLAELHRLDEQLLKQQALNEGLRILNEQLEQEVLELQQGLETVEERARQDLGMIREGESYYQVVEEESEPNTAAAENTDER